MCIIMQVHRFHEMDLSGNFVGMPLVAKEGRFEEDGQNFKYHTAFCKTQAKAKQLAEIFNERIEELEREGVLALNHADPLPRVTFLDCSVFEFQDHNGRETAVLVEKKLDNTKYKKWNSNNGFVDGQVRTQNDRRAKQQPAHTLAKQLLDTIFEIEEDDVNDGMLNQSKQVVATAADIAQAFSHFTYWESDRKLLVCDLQGVLDTTKVASGGRPVFEFTDPVIHYWSKSKRENVYGRTDRGKKGINAFWKTHKCSPLCKKIVKTTHVAKAKLTNAKFRTQRLTSNSISRPRPGRRLPQTPPPCFFDPRVHVPTAAVTSKASVASPAGSAHLSSTVFRQLSCI